MGIATLALLGAAAPKAHADTPGKHPFYIHALSDLQSARGYLTNSNEQNVEQYEGAAIIEIDQAISVIRQAAARDGKNLNAHPPVDASLTQRDRVRRAISLLDRAHQDLTAPESDVSARGWQHEAVVHVDRAGQDARQSIRTDYHDDHPLLNGSHSYFIHAISDLRAARGLLGNPNESNVAADEKGARDAITEAITDAKQGAADDGLDIFANPPATTALSSHDGLIRAKQLIQTARSLMTRSRETNANAGGPLRASVAAADRAARLIDQAIRDDHNDDRAAHH